MRVCNFYEYVYQATKLKKGIKFAENWEPINFLMIIVYNNNKSKLEFVNHEMEVMMYGIRSNFQWNSIKIGWILRSL